MPDRMCLRDSPPPFSPGVIGMKTLVATTSSSRLRNFGSRRPVATSLAPPRVGVGGVEEGDAAFDGGPDDRLGRVLVEHPGAVGVVAEAHHAEAHARDAQSGAAEIDVLHGDLRWSSATACRPGRPSARLPSGTVEPESSPAGGCRLARTVRAGILTGSPAWTYLLLMFG